MVDDKDRGYRNNKELAESMYYYSKLGYRGVFNSEQRKIADAYAREFGKRLVYGTLVSGLGNIIEVAVGVVCYPFGIVSKSMGSGGKGLEKLLLKVKVNTTKLREELTYNRGMELLLSGTVIPALRECENSDGVSLYRKVVSDDISLTGKRTQINLGVRL